MFLSPIRVSRAGEMERYSIQGSIRGETSGGNNRPCFDCSLWNSWFQSDAFLLILASTQS